MGAVAIRNVAKSFGATPVIHGIDLAVAEGEFVVLVGPSGCGKSTLLRMIAGLESITSGTIEIGGKVVNDLPPRARDIAMVFQDYALYPHKTVFENMAFGLRMRGMDKARTKEKVEAAAQVLRIGHLLARRPRELSGGQRQRVAMGRAIVRDARAFLFDEPLSNLDAQLRTEVRIEIKRLHRRFGTTTIYVTHDQVEAMTLADRIAILNAGRLEQFGTPDEIYNHPATRFVAGFTGSPPMNILEADVAPGALRLADGQGFAPGGAAQARLAKITDDKVLIGVRPEHLIIGPPDAPGPGGFSARVELVEPLGSETLAQMSLGGQSVTARVSPDSRIRAGDRVGVHMAPERIHLFDPRSGIALAR